MARNNKNKNKKEKSRYDTAVSTELCVDPASLPQTDPSFGLTSAEAEQRVQSGLGNVSVASPGKSVKAIVLSNIFTYFNLIFLIIAAALIAVGSFNHLMFLPIIVCNTLISMIQELRSKKTLDKLSLLGSRPSEVIRDGEERSVSAEALVRDDIILLSAGDQIPADAVLADGEVNVNESLVTGESDEIRKSVGDTLLSGSFIVSGTCRARLCAVGADAFAARLTLAAKKSGKAGPGGMMRTLSRLIAVIGVVLVPMGALLFWRHYVTLELGLPTAVEKTAAALLGLIPEGLYLLVSVALAVSVIRLAKSRTLVRDLRSIENLARVDVLCVDKTGTITENEMQLDRILPVGHGSSGSGEVTADDVERASSLLRDFAAAFDGGNQTMNAVKCYFGDEPTELVPDSILPFSSAYKYSAASFTSSAGEITVLLGAPDLLLRGREKTIGDQASALASEGCRVLLLAVSGQDIDSLPTDTATPIKSVIPVALITFVNPIRADAPDTFGYFTEQGVTIKVISGDSPVTASAAAASAGIPNADLFVDCSAFPEPEQLAAEVENYTVFGRVTPEQKKIMVRALKANGHTVAMTGDGVNDVLALKEADCSVAMASGSDIASKVSQLVLLDSQFSSLPAVVAEGRRVINNIQRSAALFLVKNIFSFFLAWITILSASAYPLTPAQLTLINALTIGAPSFLLSLAPNRDLIKGRFLSNVLYRAAPAAFTDLFLILGVMLFGIGFPVLTGEEISTVCALLMGLVGFIMLARVCTPFTKWKGIMYGILVAAFGGGLLIAAPLFSMAPLSLGASLVLAVFALLSYPAMFVFTKAFEAADAAKDKLLAFIRNGFE